MSSSSIPLRFLSFFDMIRDVIVSDLTYTLPCALRWIYREKITRQILPFLFKRTLNDKTKTASLYLHGPLTSSGKTSKAVLFLHGLYGHPLSLLHLTDVAQQAMDGPIFSIYLPYDENKPEMHRLFLKDAIDKIERIINQAGGKFSGVITVGHSLGGIESAFKAYVEKDTRITAVISIASRLRVVSSIDKACPDHLKETVETIDEAIQKFPELPLFQIVAGNDWNAPSEATLVRPKEGFYHIVENAMHLNVLFHKETHNKFNEYLKKAIY